MVSFTKKTSVINICKVIFVGCILLNSNFTLSETKNTKSNSKQPALVEWNKRVVVSGTVLQGEFDNCCINGESKKDRYLYLKLDKPMNINSPTRAFEPSLKGVVNIQISSNAANDYIGQAVSVECKQIIYGVTGRYALEVYCDKANIKPIKRNINNSLSVGDNKLHALVIGDCKDVSHVSCDNDIFKKVWLKLTTSLGEVYMLNTNFRKYVSGNMMNVNAFLYKPDPAGGFFNGERLTQLQFDCAGHYQELSEFQPNLTVYDIPPLSIAGKIESLACKR